MFTIWFEDFWRWSYQPDQAGKMTREDSLALEEMIKLHGRIINIGIQIGF